MGSCSQFLAFWWNEFSPRKCLIGDFVKAACRMFIAVKRKQLSQGLKTELIFVIL